MVGLEGLQAKRRFTPLPVFAIVGIQIDQVGEVMQAGANGVAVISAILKAPDISYAVKAFLGRMPRSILPAS
ncbi:MAG TPA: thiamine phosphate synthase [Nitrospiraceae bacterium]|nr:thiamine phosphate synthase [Nitrospiraceae bacterium]